MLLCDAQTLYDTGWAEGILEKRAVHSWQRRGEDRPQQPVLSRREQPQCGNNEVTTPLTQMHVFACEAHLQQY